MAHTYPAAASAIAGFIAGTILMATVALAPGQYSMAVDRTELKETSVQAAETAATETAPTEPVEISAVAPLSEDQKRLIDWTRERFAGAGLDLPEVDFVFHDSLLPCNRHVGIYFVRTNTVHMCRLDEETALHELAHAWMRHNLDEERRSQFAAFRGLAAWNDHGDPWKLRATEHAAEIMVWALMERETTVPWIAEDGEMIRKLLSIDDSTPQELAEAYRQLTGLDPAYRDVEDIVDVDEIVTAEIGDRPVGRFGA